MSSGKIEKSSVNIEECLERLRKNYKKTNREIEDSLGLSNGYISKVKKSPAALLLALNKNGISIDWLLTGEGEMFLSSVPGRAETMEISTYLTDGDVRLFKFSHGKPTAVQAYDADPNAMVMIPIFSQRAAAGKGQPPTQLAEIEAYIPVIFELLGGSHPRNCGIVRVVGDSMTDMTLFNGDLVIFDRSQIEGNGVYVISMGGDVRVKRLEYRTFDQKIIISSENRKSYPEPEVITFEQAKEMLMIHGKVISWVHRHPY